MNKQKSSCLNFWEFRNLRYRGLPQEQTVEFILPKRDAGVTFQTLVDRLENNDKTTRRLDSLPAAMDDMINLLRRTSLSMIQDLPSEEAEHKAELIQHFEPFFKEVPSQDLFALYGATTKSQETAHIFSDFKSQLLDRWKDCHKKAGKELSQNNLTEMDNQLQKIIDRALPHCSERYEGFDNSLSKEVQVQKEAQKQVQVQDVHLNTTYDL